MPYGFAAPVIPAGTAPADVTSTTNSLGPLSIAGTDTTGFESTASVTTSQATGGCRNGNATIVTDAYFSALDAPVAVSCPARSPLVPLSASNVITPAVTSGCRPTVTVHASGATKPDGKLALFSLVIVRTPNTPPAGPDTINGVGFLTERSNVTKLGEADASLFSIPSDFTKAP